jgi:hypothetical protein
MLGSEVRLELPQESMPANGRCLKNNEGCLSHKKSSLANHPINYPKSNLFITTTKIEKNKLIFVISDLIIVISEIFRTF